MKQITILGAAGFVGKILTHNAIMQGYKVKVLVRDKSKFAEFINQAEIIEGNYFNKRDLSLALQGAEVVLSTIGPPIGNKITASDESKYISSLAYIIEKMEANKQDRWINISGAGIKMTNEELPLARKLMRVRLKIASKSTINIKDQELQLLKQSKLNWTNLRPPMIKDEVKGVFVTDKNKFLGMSVDVNQLTEFMIAIIDIKKWYKKAVVVGTN